MDNRNIALLAGLLIALVPGCSSELTAIGVGAGAMPVYKRPTYDVPAQVIYRIDDKRYFTIENYEKCNKGGDVYFHDERVGLRQSVEYGGIGIWPGQFRIEPSDTHIAIPSFACGDKSCYLWIDYSTDGGKKWDDFRSWGFGLFPNMDEVRQTEVVVKANHIYVRGPRQPISRYTFDPGMNSAHVGASLAQTQDSSKSPNVSSASKQDRFTCDTSIKPKNINEAK